VRVLSPSKHQYGAQKRAGPYSSYRARDKSEGLGELLLNWMLLG